MSGAALGIHTIAIHNADFGRDFYNTYTGAVIRVSFKERLFVNGEQLSHLAPYKKAYMLQGKYWVLPFVRKRLMLRRCNVAARQPRRLCSRGASFSEQVS